MAIKVRNRHRKVTVYWVPVNRNTKAVAKNENNKGECRYGIRKIAGNYCGSLKCGRG